MPGKRSTVALLAVRTVLGCRTDGDPGPPPEFSTPLVASSTPTVKEDPAFPACPPDMVLVEGEHCPEADQRCVDLDPEHRADPSAPERCMRFAEPSTCRSSARKHLRVCVDRYEWPNRKGALPLVLVDYHQAQAHCESVNKRLCDEDEWLFACEGEEMLPYVHGYVRDPTRCVVDRLYVERPRVLEKWDSCMESEGCRSLFEALDQREPSGSFARCVSPFGVHDMNGNVNEWVTVPGAAPPRRSGLKGGWWGPVRNRCRPTVRFHEEHDWGYEIGFRCCRDAASSP
jgi:formylglycine-generating enzyme